jgi:hypothetical protein
MGNPVETKIEAVITTSGICVKLYIGAVEVSVNLEPQSDSCVPNLGKVYGYKSDMAIYINPNQETNESSENITSEFLCNNESFHYGVDAQDVFDALLFAQLKAKRLAQKEQLDKEEAAWTREQNRLFAEAKKKGKRSKSSNTPYCICDDSDDEDFDGEVDLDGNCANCGKPVREEDLEMEVL